MLAKCKQSNLCPYSSSCKCQGEEKGLHPLRSFQLRSFKVLEVTPGLGTKARQKEKDEEWKG
jgi:hypothetical protein